MHRFQHDSSIYLLEEEVSALQNALTEYQKFFIHQAISSLNEIKFKVSELLKQADELCTNIITNVMKGRIHGKDLEKTICMRALSRKSQNRLTRSLVSLKESRSFTKEQILGILSSFPPEDREQLQDKLSKIEQVCQESLFPEPIPIETTKFELGTKIKAHEMGIFSVAISDDQELFATASKDKTVKVWSFEDFKLIHVLEGHDNYVRSVAFLGDKVVSGSYDCTVKIWTGNSCTKTLRTHNGSVYSVCVSTAKNLIASGSMDKTINLYQLNQENQERHVYTLKGHTGVVYSVDFSTDAKKIISGSFDRTIKIWKTETGEMLADVKQHTDPVLCVVFYNNFVVTSSIDKSIILWQINKSETGINLRKVNDFKHGGRVESVDIDNNILLSLSKDNTIKLWNTNNNVPVQSLEGHGDHINFSDPDYNGGGLKIIPGGHAVSGGYDGIVRIWRRSDF